MKKISVIIFTTILVSIAGIAKAGNSTIENLPVNGKEEVNKTAAKQTTTYSFTLFSFFRSSESEQKVDSVSTPKDAVRKEEGINSDL